MENNYFSTLKDSLWIFKQEIFCQTDSADRPATTTNVKFFNINIFLFFFFPSLFPLNIFKVLLFSMHFLISSSKLYQNCQKDRHNDDHISFSIIITIIIIIVCQSLFCLAELEGLGKAWLTWQFCSVDRCFLQQGIGDRISFLTTITIQSAPGCIFHSTNH